MRNLLYITPQFPPHAKVGALRPLKFVRHLKKYGWDPTVYCDYHPSNTVDYKLLEGLPDDIRVERSYGWWSGREEQARGSASGTQVHIRDPDAEIPSEYRSDHSIDVPHAYYRGRQLMRQRAYDAIMVNAGPWAPLWVGRMLSQWSGVPLVCDLRDPWSICELRRPTRNRVKRRFVDAVEREIVKTASRVILNNHTTHEGYVRFYAERGVSPDKFAVIRNHADPAFSRLMPFEQTFDRFTALFLGTFRLFVLGDNLLHALTKLPALAVPPESFQVVIPRQAYKACRKQAEGLGVLPYLREIPFVPNVQSGSVMSKADLLLSLSNASAQRIPAKVYEYLLTDRPILSVAPPHAELEEMLGDDASAVTHVGLDDVEGLAKALAAAYRRGRGVTVNHRAIDDSNQASEKLAALLNDVVRGA